MIRLLKQITQLTKGVLMRENRAQESARGFVGKASATLIDK